MTRLLLIALLAVGVLAGCGSDDKSADKTSTGKTATVPSGRLGASNSEHCNPPTVAGRAIQSLDAHGITCDVAEAQLIAYLRNGDKSGYSCQERISGRYTSLTCTRPDNSTVGFYSSYRTD